MGDPSLKRRKPAMGLLFRAGLCLCLLLLFPCGALGAEAPPVQLGGAFPFEADTPLLEVFFLNIGQGDAIFLRCGGQTLLVDGGYGHQYPALLQFLLTQHGSLSVGSLLNTHQHEDHIGAQLSFLRQGGVANRFFSPLGTDASNEAYQQLYPLLAAAGTEYVQLFPGDLLDLGAPPSPEGEAMPDQGAVPLSGEFAVQRENSALLTVYRCTEADGAPDINGGSLVLHVAFGQRSILLTGDAAGYPQTFLARTQGEALSADILKAAHHGLTATTPAFLDLVNPALCIVTNDEKTAALQARQLQRRGIPGLYTAQGQVYLATDGQLWYASQEAAVVEKQ